jgi:hypothetical protein
MVTVIPSGRHGCFPEAQRTQWPVETAGTYSSGAAAILCQHPHGRPRDSKRSPAPLFHTVSARVRRELWVAYRLFVAAFREAAEKLRAGNRNADFPVGSFPPALPFVGG